MTRLNTSPRPFALLTFALLFTARAAGGQSVADTPAEEAAPPTLRWGAHAIGLWTEARPVPGRNRIREAYLTQPMLYGLAAGRAFEGRVILNFERWTLGRGELNAGVAGEGFVDRRHPHTVLHEAVGSATVGRSWRASLTAGRGFVPFGTDDPMTRPFVKYPANHHHAQILERWIGVAAVSGPRFILEGGLFNGDEPAGPTSLGRLSRFGDSWAVRGTAIPWPGLELQTSHAAVRSPENARGGGLDQRKWSASGRIVTSVAGLPVTTLAEWARTDEYSLGRQVFSFGTVLGELSVTFAETVLAARFERTTRGEEERLEDPFRSARPHSDENVIGVTRWTSGTVAVGRRVARGPLRAKPFAEVSRLRVRELTGSIFDPAEFYGSAVHWGLSLGVRLGLGASHGRVGRYGVALPAGEPHGSPDLHH